MYVQRGSWNTCWHPKTPNAEERRRGALRRPLGISNKTPPIINHHQLVENSRQSSFFVLEQKRFVLSLSRLLFVRVRAKRIYLYIYKEVCVLRGIGFRRFQCLRDFPERLVHGLVSLIPESDPVGRFPVFDRHRERHRLSDDVRLIRKASGDLDHEIR